MSDAVWERYFSEVRFHAAAKLLEQRFGVSPVEAVEVVLALEPLLASEATR